jgi:hypothetical protein
MGTGQPADAGPPKAARLSPDEAAAWDRLAVERHVVRPDIDLDNLPPKRPGMFDFKINVPTIVAAAGVIWAVVQSYADARVWQTKVEVMRQSDLDKQELRDEAIRAKLSDMADSLKILNARMDARR